MNADTRVEFEVWIPSENMGLLKKEITRINRTLTRTGQAPATYEILGERQTEPDEDGFVAAETQIQIFAPERVGIEGFEPVAHIAHLPSDDGTQVGVFTAFAGEEIPEVFRHRNFCDHCGYARRRNDTYILRATAPRTWERKGREIFSIAPGDLIQVGTGCMKKFLSGDSAAALIAWDRVLGELGELTERLKEEGALHRHRFASLSYYLLQVAGTIRAYGWIGRGEARNKPGVKSTANRAWDYAFKIGPSIQGKFPDWQDLMDEWLPARPTDADEIMADAALTWARDELDPDNGTNDYERNIHAVSMATGINKKQIGLAASIIYAFQKRQDGKRKGWTNEYLGNPGDKLTVEAALVGTYAVSDGKYIKHMFRDIDDHKLVWITGRDRSADFITGFIAFTVKSHDEWKGHKSTRINFVKPASAPSLHLHPVVRTAVEAARASMGPVSRLTDNEAVTEVLRLLDGLLGVRS